MADVRTRAALSECVRSSVGEEARHGTHHLLHLAVRDAEGPTVATSRGRDAPHVVVLVARRPRSSWRPWRLDAGSSASPGQSRIGSGSPTHTPPKRCPPPGPSFPARRWAGEAAPGPRASTRIGGGGCAARISTSVAACHARESPLDRLVPEDLCRSTTSTSTTSTGAADLRRPRGQGRLLIVNVASKCGLTPQYEGLERLHEQLRGPGLHRAGRPVQPVHGPGAGHAEEIAEFCSTTYGVTFPLTEKIEVNGDDRHPLYDELTPTPTPRATPATSAGTSRSSSSRPAARWWAASPPRSSPRRPRSSRPSRAASRLRPDRAAGLRHGRVDTHRGR